jgi:hypothetical protein
VSVTTPITHDEIAIGDYVIVQNPYGSRFAIKVEKIGDERRYIVGRQFSIAASKREGLICFNQRTKLASLRSNTTVERFEVGR